MNEQEKVNLMMDLLIEEIDRLRVSNKARRAEWVGASQRENRAAVLLRKTKDSLTLLRKKVRYQSQSNKLREEKMVRLTSTVGALQATIRQYTREAATTRESAKEDRL